MRYHPTRRDTNARVDHTHQLTTFHKHALSDPLVAYYLKPDQPATLVTATQQNMRHTTRSDNMYYPSTNAARLSIDISLLPSKANDSSRPKTYSPQGTLKRAELTLVSLLIGMGAYFPASINTAAFPCKTTIAAS
jgi:hypothetical protein